MLNIQSNSRCLLKAWVVFCGFICILTGGLTFVGLYAEIPILLRMAYGFPVMNANTAFMLIIYGCALFALAYNKRSIAIVCAGTILLIVAIAQANDFFEMQLDVDSLFTAASKEFARRYATHMSINTAVSFILYCISVFILCWRPSFRLQCLTSAVIASVAIAFGIISLLGFITQVTPAFHWRHSSPIALHAALALIIGGSGIFTSAWMFEDEKRGMFKKWLVIPVGIIALVSTLGFYQALEIYQRERIEVQQSPIALTVLVFGLCGSILSMVAIFMGQSARREQRIALDLKHRWETFIYENHDAIILADNQKKIIGWNNAAQRIFGYAEKAALGRPFTMILAKKYRDEYQSEIERYLEVEKIHYIDRTERLKGLKSDGLEFPMEISLYAWTVDGERFFISVVQDITERRRLENSVNQARDLAEKASKAKSEFLSCMSHEIRTPLTAMLGYCDLALSPKITLDTRLEYLAIVQRNGRLLLDIISDVLDFEELDARQHVDRISCSVQAIMHEVLTLFRPKTEEKNLKLEVTFVNMISTTMKTDPRRLTQILMNLVSNAIKFTKSGKIGIIVTMFDMNKANFFIQFEVTDTGIGMTQAQLSNLFKPYYQANNPVLSDPKGAGLGLMISKQLAEALGGQLTCSSKLGKGSVFTLSIPGGPISIEPIVQKRETQKDEEEGDDNIQAHILLAEDDMDIMRLIVFYLSSAGAVVESAENGKVAYQKAIASLNEPSKPFDLILMDIQMPELNGFEAVKKLRADGYKGIIIALTAYATEKEKKQCFEVGCNDIIIKPVTRIELIRKLQSCLHLGQT